MGDPRPVGTDDLFLEEIEQTRGLTPGERMALGGDLFDDLCARLRAGIRFQFPHADPERVEQILEERLQYSRELERRT